MKKTIVSLLLVVMMLLTTIPGALAEPGDTPPTPGTGETSVSLEMGSDPDGSTEPEATAEDAPEAAPAADAPEATPAGTAEATPEAGSEDTPEGTADPSPEATEAIPEAGSEDTPKDDDPPEEETGAEEDEDLIRIGELYTLTADSDIFSGNNDALFTGYVEQMFRSGRTESLTFPRNRSLPDPHEVLSDEQYAVENALKTVIRSIAAGRRTSTAIEMTLSSVNLSYSVARQMNMTKVFHTLLLDCTYELYWFGRQLSWGFLSETKMVFNFYVAEEYAADDTGLKVKTSAISAALTAVDRANGILTSCAALSDAEKLRAYKNEICRLTSYNEDAAYTDIYDGQEGPWSLVWVFDGDPETGVVCEGYAKAFEYLCNRSNFQSSLINCYCVSGPAVFSNGASGPHMWNIVTMDDGRNYVIDVTSCDTDDTGSDTFFLCYGLDGSPQEGYLLSCVAMYLYDDTALNACSDRARTLASTPYQGAPGDVKITQQPQKQRVVEGQEATFNVTATGSGLSYQWYWFSLTDLAWHKLNDETQPTLTVTGLEDLDETLYYCLVTGPSGKRASESAVLEVVVAPTIVKQPEDATVNVGEKPVLSVEATGTYLTYRWHERTSPNAEWRAIGTTIEDMTLNGKGPTYRPSTFQGTDGYQYYCEVSNDFGTVSSDIVTVTVICPPTRPSWDYMRDVAVLPGETATFHVIVEGKFLSYQWYRMENHQKTLIPGATEETYSFVATADMDGDMYICDVTNPAGVYTAEAHLYIITEPPTITQQPGDKYVRLGTHADFLIQADGKGLSYQWYCYDGEREYAIPDATKDVCSTPQMKEEYEGYQYWCVVSNAIGSVTSERATLRVLWPPVIIQDVRDVTVRDGEIATFSFIVEGNGLVYGWDIAYSPTYLHSINSPTYSITASPDHNGLMVRCRASNSAGFVFSQWGTLTVLPAGAELPFEPPAGENYVYFGSDDLPAGRTVEVDGASYPLSEENSILLPDGVKVDFVTEYTFNKTGQDPHEIYPTAMKVWKVTVEGERQVAKHISELDNVLQYSGSSIRITGNKGIRMITSVPKDKKQALTGKNGISGWTLVEYGTVVAWDSELGGDPLTLGHAAAKRAYAYKKGVADPVFNDTGKLIQYTNVLVGMTNEKCAPDLAMRPYMILQNKAGTQATLYGGTIHRSIGYIAWQNRKAFQPGTAAYAFIWDIIHFVYGDLYDADYKK